MKDQSRSLTNSQNITRQVNSEMDEGRSNTVICLFSKSVSLCFVLTWSNPSTAFLCGTYASPGLWGSILTNPRKYMATYMHCTTRFLTSFLYGNLACEWISSADSNFVRLPSLADTHGHIPSGWWAGLPACDWYLCRILRWLSPGILRSALDDREIKLHEILTACPFHLICFVARASECHKHYTEKCYID